MKKIEDPALIETDVPGYFVDKKSGAIMNLNPDEKRIYDLQISLEMMRNDMDNLRKLIKKMGI